MGWKPSGSSLVVGAAYAEAAKALRLRKMVLREYIVSKELSEMLG